jgi:hypothetical protein
MTSSLRTTGSKGSDVYTSEGLGNTLLDLSVSLIRGVSYLDVRSKFEKLIDSSSDVYLKSMIEDVLVLAFQTRDIRGGKGERLASEHLFKCLLSSPVTREVTLEILDLVPEFGSWRDLFALGTSYCGPKLVDIVEIQFIKDEAALETGGSLSLLAKWIPREGDSDLIPFLVRLVPGLMFSPSRMKLYRKRVSRLNRAIDTVEIKMCANEWKRIEPSKVPGKAMEKYANALLNEKKTKMRGGTYSPVLRHPNSADRMLCRQSFQTYFQKTVLGELKAKSDTVFPHEIVKKATELIGGSMYNPEDAPYDEMNRLEGVWRSIVHKARETGGLTKSLALCDFSGSMQNSSRNKDTPYWVSLALGLLISDLSTDEFKNTILSFDSTPKFHIFPEAGLFRKLGSIDKELGQGRSTDFQAAMDLVLKVLKESRARPGDEPKNLIVLTDMAWDSACSSSQQNSYNGNTYRNIVKTNEWQTHIEMIREAFKRGGEDIWGVGNGWTMPRIVIWNLAADPKDFHATSETDGVVMLSGWSPNLFKVIQGNGIAVKTPMDGLRVQLNNQRYAPVRDRVRRFFNIDSDNEENIFAYY